MAKGASSIEQPHPINATSMHMQGPARDHPSAPTMAKERNLEGVGDSAGPGSLDLAGSRDLDGSIWMTAVKVG